MEKIIRVCDRCASDEPPAEHPAETIDVTIGGESYRVDLCDLHRAEWSDLVGHVDAFLRFARAPEPKPKRGKREPDAARSAAAKEREAEAKKVRAWAQEHGYAIGAFGRIGADVRTAYEAAVAGTGSAVVDAAILREAVASVALDRSGDGQTFVVDEPVAAEPVRRPSPIALAERTPTRDVVCSRCGDRGHSFAFCPKTVDSRRVE